MKNKLTGGDLGYQLFAIQLDENDRLEYINSIDRKYHMDLLLFYRKDTSENTEPWEFIGLNSRQRWNSSTAENALLAIKNRSYRAAGPRWLELEPASLSLSRKSASFRFRAL